MPRATRPSSRRNRHTKPRHFGQPTDVTDDNDNARPQRSGTYILPNAAVGRGVGESLYGREGERQSRKEKTESAKAKAEGPERPNSACLRNPLGLNIKRV